MSLVFSPKANSETRDEGPHVRAPQAKATRPNYLGKGVQKGTKVFAVLDTFESGEFCGIWQEGRA
jgi:hypothetical protein